jgi:ribosome-associated protein
MTVHRARRVGECDVGERDDLSKRQLARRETRLAGAHSSQLARELMEVPAWMLGKLELDEELLETIARARAVTAQVARRRAERTLAGELRGVDLAVLRDRLASVRATGTVDTERQRLAERWRTRLLDEGDPAIAELVGDAPDHELPGLVSRARRERDTGKPAGAGRALFRHVVELLKARADDDEG